MSNRPMTSMANQHWTIQSALCNRHSAFDDALIPNLFRRRPEVPCGYRAGRAGACAAQEERRDVEGAVSIPWREDALVSCERRQGLLPLFRMRAWRRRDQVR